jgi:hypothetical protein
VAFSLDLFECVVERCVGRSAAGQVRGGAIFLGAGDVRMGNRTLLRDISIEGVETRGRIIFIQGGALMYSLPVPPGRWLPNARCEVYRAACEENSKLDECLAQRDDCEVLADVGDKPPVGPTGDCRPSVQVQPCPWLINPELLGDDLYYFPKDAEDEDFPYECAVGLLGSADPALQKSATCAGRCPAGSLCPAPATFELTPCKPGSHCPEGSAVAIPCSTGRWGNATNLASDTECTQTAPGFFAPTGSVHPTPCAAGTVAPTRGLGGCVLCEPGTYQDGIGATQCKPCEAGAYCPSGASAALPCKEGSFTQWTDLASAEQCTRTVPGFFAPTGSVQPIACPMGAVAPTFSLGRCADCEPGTFQNDRGRTGCAPCALGAHCGAAGLAAPILCPPGAHAAACGIGSPR